MFEQWKSGDRVYWKPNGEPGTVKDSGADTVIVFMDDGSAVMAPPDDFDWYTRPKAVGVEVTEARG